MTVRIGDDAIHLEGRCLVEDAEELLLALQTHPDRTIDVSAVQRLHLAVAQVLLAFGPRLRGSPAQPFLADHVLGSAAFSRES
jgi:hypothetical protein